MKPIEFKGQNVIYAKNQPEYLPLPAYVNDNETVSCWEFTQDEKIAIANGSPLWIWQMNFKKPLQPIMPTFEHPFGEPIVLESVTCDIFHTTNTVFDFWDRVKILFGKRVKIESTITVNAMCNVIKSEAKTIVFPFIKPRIGSVELESPTHSKS